MFLSFFVLFHVLICVSAMVSGCFGLFIRFYGPLQRGRCRVFGCPGVLEELTGRLRRLGHDRPHDQGPGELERLDEVKAESWGRTP